LAWHAGDIPQPDEPDRTYGGVKARLGSVDAPAHLESGAAEAGR
jgi:hypothetical protein